MRSLDDQDGHDVVEAYSSGIGQTEVETPPQRVATLGDNCVDRYVAEGHPTGPEFPGGNAVNVAVWLRFAGFQTSYLGFVGDDQEGQFIIDHLRRWGVDVSGVETRPGATGVTRLQIGLEGEREFLTEEYGVAEDFGAPDVPPGRLVGVPWIHAARLASSSGLGDLGQPSAAVSYDFTDEWTTADIDRICPALDVAFFSIGSTSSDMAAQVAVHAIEAGAQLAVVTRGVAGSLASDGTTVLTQGSFEVPVVDTLGAGDAFIAGFIADTLRGATVEQALRSAALNGAEACTLAGAWPPTAEMESIGRTTKPATSEFDMTEDQSNRGANT